MADGDEDDGAGGGKWIGEGAERDGGGGNYRKRGCEMADAFRVPPRDG